MSDPRLLSRRELASTAAERWRSTYYTTKTGEWRCFDTSGAIYDTLLALGPEPDPDAVDRAIGNGSWTSIRCNGCERYVEVGVEVGDTFDYDSSTATLCADCVRAAAALLGGGR